MLNYPFSFYSLSKFKFRNKLYICKIGYSRGLSDLDDYKSESEKLKYYFNSQDSIEEFQIKSNDSLQNDQVLNVGDIPETVKTLIFLIRLGKLDLNALPSTLKTLIVIDYDPQSFQVIPNNDIPEFIENLQIGSTIAKVYNLPVKLRALSLIGRSDSYISELPCKNLQYLEFGGFYSKSIDHLLPSLNNLKTLILGGSYLQTIKCTLPNSLEFLSLCCSFEENTLPNSLKVLEIGSNNVSVSSKLPNSLKCIIFKSGTGENIQVGDLPDSIEYIDFGRGYSFNNGFSILPKNCNELLFGDSFNSDFYETDYENLPSSLTSITFGKNFNQDIPIECIPKSIKTISFKNDYKMYKVQHLSKLNIKLNKHSIINNNDQIYNYYTNNQHPIYNILNRYINNPIVFNNYNLNNI